MQKSQQTCPVPNCVRSLAGRPRKTGPATLAPYVRCPCGTCLWCQDNAKWDKVFEKFVDPTYYQGSRPTVMGSPLADF